jgi:hypothetical protein
MNTVATAVLLAVSLAGVATPANAVIDTTSASSPVSYYIDDSAPQPPPSPGDTSLPLPLPVGSQGVPPGVEVYCPGLPWIHDCHQCLGDRNTDAGTARADRSLGSNRSMRYAQLQRDSAPFAGGEFAQHCVNQGGISYLHVIRNLA